MKLFFVVSTTALLHAIALAQLAQGPATGSVPSGVTVNTNSFESVDGPGGIGPVQRIAPNKAPIPPLPMPANMPAPTGPEGSNYYEDPSVRSDSPLAPPPITLSSFDGIPMTNSIPPDPHVAVGPNHIIQVVNTSWRITDKNGNVLKTITADSWFASAFGSNPGAFDPKVHYDHFAGRWIMVWLHQNDGNQTAAFLVSVSDDSDPIGTWYNWSLPSNVYGSSTNGSWADYQGVGFDQQAFYITANQFGFNSTGYQGARVRIMAKAQFYANTAGAISWTDFWGLRDLSGNDVFGTRPSVVYSSPSVYYMVGKPNFTGGTYYAVYRISNPITSPTLSCVHVPVTAWSNAPNSGQLGGGTPLLESGSSGIRNEPIYRDSSLWITHNIASSGYSAVRYVRINTVTNTATEDAALGALGFWHFYPALVVDKDKNIGITFSRSGDTEFAGAYFTWRLNSDPPGLRPTELIRPGAGNYVVTFGGTRNRWGDYLGAALDPADQNHVWFLSEYANATNRWGVWVHGVRFVPFTGARLASTVQSRDFGRIEANRSSDTLEIKLNNVGSTTLTISAITKSSAAYNFISLPTLPLNLATFDSVKLRVFFRPTTQGTVNDTVRIATNESGNPTYKIPLNGRGVVIGKATAGVLYGASGAIGTSSLYTVNTSTGAATLVGVTGVSEIQSLAIHPATRELYGILTAAGSTALYRISSAFGDALPAGTLQLGNVRGIVFANDSILFATTNIGKLYRVDTRTGDTTFVGASATPLAYAGLALSPSGKLWASVRPPIANRDKIYIINSTTGAATEVGSTGGANTTPAIAFDARGKLYGLKGTATQIDTLIVIDTTTAFGTRIGSMGFAGIQALAMRIDSVGTVDVKELAGTIPASYVLNQNYPNPFNPTTQISYGIPEASHVKLAVYNSLGQLIAQLIDGEQAAGSYVATWNGKSGTGVNVASGIYFYRIDATGETGRTFSQTRKLVLLR